MVSSYQNDIYAYLAGFIDADGSISITTAKYDSKISYRIKLSAHNCKKEPIDLLAAQFGGGKIRFKKTGKARLHNNWRPCYEWIITCNKAADAIRKLIPFLLVKREQALICLELDDINKNNSSVQRRWNPKLNEEIQQKFAHFKEKINLLNKRGLSSEFR